METFLLRAQNLSLMEKTMLCERRKTRVEHTKIQFKTCEKGKKEYDLVLSKLRALTILKM